MARLQPLPPDTTPELKPHFDFFLVEFHSFVFQDF